jgi:hypothetical protein
MVSPSNSAFLRPCRHRGRLLLHPSGTRCAFLTSFSPRRCMRLRHEVLVVDSTPHRRTLFFFFFCPTNFSVFEKHNRKKGDVQPICKRKSQRTARNASVKGEPRPRVKIPDTTDETTGQSRISSRVDMGETTDTGTGLCSGVHSVAASDRIQRIRT